MEEEKRTKAHRMKISLIDTLRYYYAKYQTYVIIGAIFLLFFLLFVVWVIIK